MLPFLFPFYCPSFVCRDTSRKHTIIGLFLQPDCRRDRQIEIAREVEGVTLQGHRTSRHINDVESARAWQEAGGASSLPKRRNEHCWPPVMRRHPRWCRLSVYREAYRSGILPDGWRPEQKHATGQALRMVYFLDDLFADFREHSWMITGQVMLVSHLEQCKHLTVC